MDNGTGSNFENVIDRISLSAKELKKKLEVIKEDKKVSNCDYQDKLKDIHRLKKLERENLELKKALEDHQYGLEFIMSKYRSQVVQLIKLNKLEKASPLPDIVRLRRNNSAD